MRVKGGADLQRVTETSEISVFSVVTIPKLGTRSMLFQVFFNLPHEIVSYFLSPTMSILLFQIRILNL